MLLENHGNHSLCYTRDVTHCLYIFFLKYAHISGKTSWFMFKKIKVFIARMNANNNTVCLCLYRPYWRCYYSNTDAIIYVVDSMDRDRIGISKQELFSMLEVK